MNIVLFTHPEFLESQSMPRFAKMLINGMQSRGHNVCHWSPSSYFYKFPAPKFLKKWLGYIDQYILFPAKVLKYLKSCPSDTLFVFTDNALGPWVPLVADRPHVIHCHDFLAQQSALGQITENPTSMSGQQYQAFIRRGYSHGKNFISVSNKTKEDLHKLLPYTPICSEVVYNGLNQPFNHVPSSQEARRHLQQATGIDLAGGYLLHVGGNQWYKNRKGVITIYDAWRQLTGRKLPILLIGATPNAALSGRYQQSPYRDDIHVLTGLDNETVRVAYAGASVFIFPSLAEGFGWPIAEAMASGCPVITTNEAPMTEVAGSAGFYIPRCPTPNQDLGQWALQSAKVVEKVLNLSNSKRAMTIEEGYRNVARFDSDAALKQIEVIYKKVIGISEELTYSEV